MEVWVLDGPEVEALHCLVGWAIGVDCQLRGRYTDTPNDLEQLWGFGTSANDPLDVIVVCGKPPIEKRNSSGIS